MVIYLQRDVITAVTAKFGKGVDRNFPYDTWHQNIVCKVILYIW